MLWTVDDSGFGMAHLARITKRTANYIGVYDYIGKEERKAIFNRLSASRNNQISVKMQHKIV